jgi:HK97 family phage major capsid protein
MNPTLKRLVEDRDSQAEYVSHLLEGVEAEARDLSSTEREAVTRAEARMVELEEQIAALNSFEERRAAAAQVSSFNAPAPRVHTSPRPEFRSLGQQFVESEQLRAFSGHGTSGRFELDGAPWQFEDRATLVTTADPGKSLLPAADKYRGNDHLLRHPLLGLVSRVETTASSVEVVTTSDATGHDVVAEGGKKPEVTWSTTLTPHTLQMIAGWMKASRQILEDVPNMRGLIDGKLQRSLDNKLNGLCVAAITGAFTAGNTSTGGAGAKMLDQIRLGIGALEGRGIMPTAILLNPADYAGLDIALLGMNTGLGAVVSSSYFGLPVVSSPDIPAKTAIIGDLSEAVTWFYKGSTSLFVTDSDVTEAGGSGGGATSDFQRNIITFLLETRGVFAATDASALQKVTIP